MFMIENTIRAVTLSQSGCEDYEDGFVKIDSGACVNVCPSWFGKSTLEQPDGSIRLGGADGRALQEYGKRQIWLRIGGQIKQNVFHVVDVTKPILSVSCLCEKAIETHLASQPFLKCGDRREPLIRKGGVFFVRTQIVHEVKEDRSMNSCLRAGDSQNKNSCVRAGDSQNSQNSCVRAGASVKTGNPQNSCLR